MIYYQSILGEDNFTTVQVGNADYPKTISTADFDDDGDLDVLVGGTGDNGLSWSENTGTATAPQFGPMNTDQGRISGGAAADLDADGYTDFVSYGENTYYYYDVQLNVHYFNPASATDTEAPAYVRVVLIGKAAANLAVGDVDGDCMFDLRDFNW